MKKYKEWIALVMGFLMIFATPVFAQAEDLNLASTAQAQSLILPPNQLQSRIVAKDPRGIYFGTGILSISNAGKGRIGVSAATLCYEPVDQINMRIYIDMLNEDEKWVQQNRWDFTFLPEDEPDGILTDVLISFEILDRPVNRYYRLRGIHSVRKGETVEGLTSETNGVLITKYP